MTDEEYDRRLQYWIGFWWSAFLALVVMPVISFAYVTGWLHAVGWF